MIGIASRATTGVSVPNRKATRHEIMELFKLQMTKLKERLNVCYLSYFRLQCNLCISNVKLEPDGQGRNKPDL